MYTFIIGSASDFTSGLALRVAFLDGTLGNRNHSVFQFELPVANYSGFEGRERGCAFLIGKGMAFEAGWCKDDVYMSLIDPH